MLGCFVALALQSCMNAVISAALRVVHCVDMATESTCSACCHSRCARGTQQHDALSMALRRECTYLLRAFCGSMRTAGHCSKRSESCTSAVAMSSRSFERTAAAWLCTMASILSTGGAFALASTTDSGAA